MHNIFVLLLSYGAGYAVFLCLSFVAKVYSANRLILNDGSLSRSPMLLVLHSVGIVVFGMVPYWIGHKTSFTLFNSDNGTHLSTAVSLLLLLLMLFLSPRMAAKTYAVQDHVIPNRMPAPYFLPVYFFLRILFIAAYEWWFRGFLLAGTIALWGVPLAVCLNVALYTLLHTVNGKKEMMGCLPFGLLLCTLCIWQQAVWPAMALHLALTIPYEITLLKKLKTNKLPYEHSYHRRIGLHRA